MNAKFGPGRVVATPGALDALTASGGGDHRGNRPVAVHRQQLAGLDFGRDDHPARTGFRFHAALPGHDFDHQSARIDPAR